MTLRDIGGEHQLLDRAQARRTPPLLPLLLALFVALLAFCGSASAVTIYVDGPNPACDNAGPGTEEIPYCTIGAANAAYNGPGVTIAVKPGTYSETVRVIKGGISGSPFVLKALGPDVVIMGDIITSARHWLVIDGFTVHAVQEGIRIGSSDFCVVTGNTVYGAGGPSQYGMYVSYSTGHYIANNTVTNPGNHAFVIRAVTESVIEGNVAHHSETGFLLKLGSHGNVVRRNRSYANTHTGFYYHSTRNTQSIQNLAWDNGLYGFMLLGALGSKQNGDVAWMNANDGITIRGAGVELRNCIAVDNGGTGDHNLYVTVGSTDEILLDDNIFWSSTGEPPIKFGDVEYTRMSNFTRETGKGARTLIANPQLLNPAAGDFRLTQGSPAIDAANTQGGTAWPGSDFDGRAPFDDPDTPNSGIGPIDHGDRGAFEFVPSGTPPMAALDIRPVFETPTRQFIVDASASFDAEGPILMYRFDFGDGSVLGPQPEAVVPHTYPGGTWTTTVTAIDTSGLIGTASMEVVVDPSHPDKIYYVDGSSPTCNDGSPGTEDEPFCTINAAYRSYNGPGVTLRVKPGVYDESLMISEAGAPGEHFVLQATGPGTVINGTISSSARPFVTIDGFAVGRIYVGSSDNWAVTRNSAHTIEFSYSGGHYVAGNTAAMYEIRRVTDSVFEDNVSRGGEHGFHLKEGAYGNVLRRNRASGALKNGFYFENSGDNLVVHNLAWENGEHGIHTKRAPYNRYIGCVVWGNAEDGISLRGESIGTTVHNSIFVNNGIAGSAPDFYADTLAAPGIVMNDNIIWNPTDKKPIRFGASSYETLAEFAAMTGHGTRSFQVDPLFLDPTSGNFRLIQGSPAIDNANSGLVEWPETDFLGVTPSDDLGTPNSGIGPIDYADRGAFEFAPTGSPPVAVLNVTRVSEPPALNYIVDASASFDADGSFLRYAFDFGDGATLAPQSEAVVTHTYPPGAWVTSVTVIDSSGLVARASIEVNTEDPVPVIASFVGVEAHPAEVTLTWHVSSLEDDEVTVYRREPEGDWRLVESKTPNAEGFVVFRDDDVRPGKRFGYRLGLVSDGRLGFFAEAWVDVPVAFELAVEGVRRAVSGLSVDFQLPRAGGAELSLVDVAGRRLAERRLGGLAAGSHHSGLEARALPSGIYWVRLRQGDRIATRKTVVVR